MGNQQDTSCFASKVHERKFHSDVIHKSKKERDLATKKYEKIPELSRSSQLSKSLIEPHDLKDLFPLSKNSKTITIQITINLKENQQLNIDSITTKEPFQVEIEKTLASSLKSYDELRKDNSSSEEKEFSTKSNTFGVPSKKKIIFEALSKSSKAEEFDKLSLPSQSNYSDDL